MKVEEHFIISDNGIKFDRRHYVLNNAGQIMKRKHRRPVPNNDDIPIYKKLFAYFMVNPDASPQAAQKAFNLKSDTTAYAERKKARIALKKEGKWDGPITTYKKHNKRRKAKHRTVEERGIPEEVLTKDWEAEKGQRPHIGHISVPTPDMPKEDLAAVAHRVTQGTGRIAPWQTAFAIMISAAVTDLENGQDSSMVASRLRVLADALDR
jgi:hypothetical protein